MVTFASGLAGLRREITDGIRFVFGNPVPRAFLAAGACTNISIIMINTMLPVVFVRELGLSTTALGLYLAVGDVGTLAGLLGELTSPRAALWAGAVGLALVWLPIYLSPVRTMRHPA